MIDKDKVIKGLEYCVGHHLCFGCGYYDPDNTRCQKELMRDALELLKEQEPILLENQHKSGGHIINANSPWISRCPKCGKKIEGKQTRFCKYCGQAVKWDE